MKRFYLIILLCTSALLVAAEPGLIPFGIHRDRPLSADAPLYRVIVRNQNTTPMTVSGIALSANGSSIAITPDHPSVLWWRCLPAQLPPGGFAELRCKMANNDSLPGSVRLEGSDGTAFTVDLPATASQLTVRSLRYCTADRMWCAYWYHEGVGDLTLSEVAFDGRRITPTSGTTTGAREVRCLAWPAPVAPRPGDTHLLSLRAANGVRQDVLVKVGIPAHVAFEDGAAVLPVAGVRLASTQFPGTPAAHTSEGAVCFLRECLTHGDGTLQSRGWDVLHRGRALIASDREPLVGVHLCRFRIDDGLSWFGAISDVVRLNPFAFNVGERARDLREPLRLLAAARAEVGCGQVIALVPVAGSDDPQLWPRVLTALAQGCAGVHLRVGDAGAPVDPRAAEAIATALLPLRPTLALWDAAELLGDIPLEDTAARAWLVQLGPRRLAIVAVDGSPASVPRVLQLAVQLPRGLRAQRLVDLGGTELQTLSYLPNHLTLQMPEFSDGSVIYIELAQPEEIGDE